MNFEMSAELDMLRATARRFVDEEFRPIEQQVDEPVSVDPEILRRLRRKAVEIGLYAFNLPTSIGGGGLSSMAQVVVAEELGRSTMTLARTAGYLPGMLVDSAPHQRSWFTDPIVRGEKVLAYAVTEPSGGSDMGAMKTRARREHGKWVLSGAKAYISMADVADYIAVVAVTDPEAALRKRFTLFIVERDNPGFHFHRRIKKMGWWGSDFCAFSLDDCVVPDEHVLGEVGEGFRSIMGTINGTRIYLGGFYVGMAEELMKHARAYANDRITFGSKLSEHQAIQFMMADSDMELEAARLLTYRAAAALDSRNPEMRIAAARAKCYAAEMVGRVADRVLQVFGAAGYTRDFPIERMFRDARAFRIGEGSSEMLRVQIARHVFG